MLVYEKSYLKVEKNDVNIAIHNFFTDSSDPPMVFIHGSLENGRIFYSKNNKGIAPFFARNGFNCYVIDLRGRGDSRPRVSKDFDFRQLDVINDLLSIYKYIELSHPSKNQVWLSHSWGGVLLNCALLRFQQQMKLVNRLVHIAVKRSISTKNIQKFIAIDVVFNRLMKKQAIIQGYLPPTLFGVDSEARSYHLDVIKWVDKDSEFLDPSDQLNYSMTAKFYDLPKSLYITAAKDPYLGNIVDVKRFIKECHHANSTLLHFSKSNGARHNYNHNDIITHEDCPVDVYPKIMKWLKL